MRKLFRALFNLPPFRGIPYLLAEDGQKIWYYCEGQPIDDIRFFYRGKWIGRVQLTWHSDYLEISDIVIYKNKYRKIGIGSQMFALVKEIALNHQMPRISGRMQAETTDDWARLVNFYKKQGCHIEANCFFLDLVEKP